MTDLHVIPTHPGRYQETARISVGPFTISAHADTMASAVLLAALMASRITPTTGQNVMIDGGARRAQTDAGMLAMGGWDVTNRDPDYVPMVSTGDELRAIASHHYEQLRNADLEVTWDRDYAAYGVALGIGGSTW